jgi:hypothetical protein
MIMANFLRAPQSEEFDPRNSITLNGVLAVEIVEGVGQ